MPSRRLVWRYGNPSDVFPLFRPRRTLGHDTFDRNDVRQAKRRFENLNVVGAPARRQCRARGRHLRGSLVSPENARRVCRVGNFRTAGFSESLLPYRFGNPGALKRLNDVAKLTDINPHNLIGDRFYVRIGFTSVGDGNDKVTFALRFRRKYQRKLSIAGD